jgi:hypothetical protein
MLCIQRLRDPCRTKLPVHSAANLWMGALRKGCAQQASAHAPTLRTRLTMPHPCWTVEARWVRLAHLPSRPVDCPGASC